LLKFQIDLSVDPPPDLAIEVEISRSMLNRMGIYASLGVPEIWWFDGTTLSIHTLNRRGEYEQVERSGQFPFLPLGELQGFLSRRGQLSETELIRVLAAHARLVLNVIALVGLQSHGASLLF
jgi:Uma2 family endonuclease